MALSACSKLPMPSIAHSEGVGDMVVFDIDGTLTPENRDILEVRKAAAEVAKGYADRGYHVLYLTARRPYLQQPIPGWLRKHGFPDGDLQTAQSNDDNRHPAEFKMRVMDEYKRAGWKLRYGYGDSSTDFEAYAKVGIPKDHVFALRRENERTCQPGVYAQCLVGYTEHKPFLQSVPKVQP